MRDSNAVAPKHRMTVMPPAEAARSVVRVKEGRGFVVQDGEGQRYIVTAARCLPHLPPAWWFSLAADVTYPDVLGPLDATTLAVRAQYLFVNPVADIAVPGHRKTREPYEAFVGGAGSARLKAGAGGGTGVAVGGGGAHRARFWDCAGSRW